MREPRRTVVVVFLVVVLGAVVAGGVQGDTVGGPNQQTVMNGATTTVSGLDVPDRSGERPYSTVSGETVELSAASTIRRQDTPTLESAVDDSTTVSFTFTANGDGNQTFTAASGTTVNGVSFEFSEWRDTSTGASGTSRTWDGQAGQTYEVTYEASSSAGVETGERTFSASVDYDGGTASADLSVRVIGPEFGSIQIQSSEAVLRGDSGIRTERQLSFDVSNQGDGVLVPESVSFDGLPAGFDLEASLPEEVPGRPDGDVQREVTVDASISHNVEADDYEFTATVTDSLGNQQAYDLSLTVVKPPTVGVQSARLRIENVTAGETTTQEVVIEETSGFDSVDDISYRVESPDGNVSNLEFVDLDQVSLDAGESTTANVSVTVDEDVERNRELSWTIVTYPDDEYALETETSAEAEVLYQAAYSSVDLRNDTVVYDEPKDDVDAITQNLTVELENEGDFPLNVTESDVRFNGTALSVVNVTVNETIAPQSTDTAVIAVEGDPEAFEQLVTLQFELNGLTVRGDEVEPARFNESVAIEHEVELVVRTKRVEFGRVQATGESRGTIEVAERLGYRDVESFRIRQLSGPENDWLTFLQDPPDTISAGQSVELPIRLAFDVQAELFTTYEWSYLVEGQDVNESEVVVTGTPEPVNVDPVRNDLAEYEGRDGSSGEIANEMLAIVDDVEAGVESGRIPRSDIATALSAGRSIALLLTELDAAEQALDSEGPAAAQESVVRAATAYNTFVLFSDQFEDESLRERADRIDDLASTQINDLAAQQEARFQEQLDADPPLIEQARLKRQLSELAVLQGETDRAERLEREADEAFEAYADRIESGEASFRTARDARNRIADEHGFEAFGQPVLLNPLRYDDFLADREQSLDAYDEAITDFRTAGATERAETVAAERDRAAAELAITRLSMFASLAAYAALAVLVAIHISLGVRAYRLDREAVAPDEFLE